MVITLMIKVILKEDILGQGKKNDVVEVSDGFARNFLLPRGKVVLASPEGIQKVEEERTRSLEERGKAKEKNVELKEKIASLEITIQKKAKEGKLFGGLNAKEVSEALAKKGVKIESRKVIFESPIKTLGLHNIGIALNNNIKVALKVKVVEG